MSGSDEEGDYTLDIDSVMLEDDAMFQCQVGAAPGGVQPIRSRYSSLTVTVPPESPEIMGENILSTQEDRLVSLECVSRAGKPAAEITWLDDNKLPITTGVKTTVETLPDGKRQNTRSVLTLRMLRSHHNTSISCSAVNSAEVTARSASVLVKVEFAPWLRLQHSPARLREGDTAVFRCRAQANPDKIGFSWLVDNQEVEGGVNQPHVLILPTVTRSDNGAIVKCRGSNIIGKSEETHTLDIYYNPEFLRKPEDVSADPGQQISLECLTDGNPPPLYRWFHNRDLATVLSESSQLNLTISSATVGRYTCMVQAQGSSEIRASAWVYQRGPPRILRPVDGAASSGEVGQTVQLSCEAFALPVPEGMVWQYNNRPINSHTEHYQVLTKKRRDGLVSTLLIKDSVMSDFGEYNCSVRNPYGEDFLMLKLQKTESSLLLLVLVGVVSGAILVLSVLLVFLHWRRLQQKACPAPGRGKQAEAAAECSEEEDEWQTETAATENTDTSNKPGPLSPYSPHLAPLPAPLGPSLTQLNVTDPRYTAKYGNPYLREDPTPAMPHLMQHSPYNTRNHFSTQPRPVSFHSPSANRQLYQTCTLPQPQPTVRRDGTVPAHYIQAQDELTEGHLATHV